VGAKQRKAQGVAGIRLTISVMGTPVRCEITASSNDVELDEKTCALLMERARFAPATDRTGIAIPGTWTSAVRWRLPVMDSKPVPISQQLLPPPRPGKLVETYDIRTDGTKTDCRVDAFGALAELVPPYDPAALCLNFIHYKPILDPSGKPVRTHFVVETTVKATPVP
jgi:hypothetical protein